MKTILIILALIFISITIFMYIIESRIKNRTKSKLFWELNNDLTDSDLIDEIEKK
jgi:preprotein translocase subunit SecG